MDFSIFDKLRAIVTHIFLFLSVFLKAQDKIFLLNGEVKKVKVTEITSEEVLFVEDGNNLSLNKPEILLIEFKNGFVEVITVPAENKVFAIKEEDKDRRLKNVKKLKPTNELAINSLALCNQDAALFYEKQLAESRIGVGVMGAFNFNPIGSLYNIHIATLNSGKKNYDLGAYANIYFGPNKRENYFYFGLMLKYTQLSFKQTISTNSVVTYQPANGYQLATLLTIGNKINFENNFFIKTIYGLGGFNLNGVYQTEYNKSNTTGGGSGASGNRKFLAKLYFGVNAGFNF